MRDFHSLGIDVNRRTAGHIKTTCPHCTETRHNKRDKSLSVNLDMVSSFATTAAGKAVSPTKPNSANAAKGRSRANGSKYLPPIFAARPSTSPG